MGSGSTYATKLLETGTGRRDGLGNMSPNICKNLIVGRRLAYTADDYFFFFLF